MRSILLLCAVLAAAGPSRAQTAPEVDVELLLLVDVSRSMTPGELEIQRRGYAEALVSPEVVEAMLNGFLGRVALSYAEWAGTGSQRVIVDWRVVDSAEAARAFADELANAFNPSMRRTSISGALDWGAASLAGNGIDGLRRVIDISGDGPNNEGPPVTDARDRTVALGITVNGLPLMTREGMGMRWHLDDLDRYYAECVVGGAGAFVLPVESWAAFGPAIRRKLVLELAGPVAALVPAQFDAEPAYDCLVGERIWERNRRVYDLP